MKFAAYQAPLSATSSRDAVELLRRQVERCEKENVTVLCCPEAIIGGLADYSENPRAFSVGIPQLESVLAPMSSDTVTTLVGFTERGQEEQLYNSAAVMRRGAVVGLYRKQRPAINRSVYSAGCDAAVFRIHGLVFGIVICNDSNFPELVRQMSMQGATALFVPSNNGLPPGRADEKLVAQTRRVDIARAIENRMWVVRADVAGHGRGLVSCGSSAIIRPDGTIARAATPLHEELLVVDTSSADQSS